jgi:hypothetical protein
MVLAICEGELQPLAKAAVGKYSKSVLGHSLVRDRELIESWTLAYLTFKASGTALGLNTCARIAWRIWGSALSNMLEKSRQVCRRELRERRSGSDFMMQRMSSFGRS